MARKPTREDLEDALLNISEILQDLGLLPEEADEVDEDAEADQEDGQV